MDSTLSKLSGGDMRSIGRADEVVCDVIDNPALFGEVFLGMKHPDPLIRMRSADVIEKVSRLHPEYLRPHWHSLVGDIARIPQKEVCWYVAQMLPRLELEDEELDEVIDMLFSWAQRDSSRIVQVNAMTALAEMAADDTGLRGRVVGVLRELVRSGSPAVRSRGKKLLRELE
ncbi:MAG: hypothetical protein R6U70_02455 [Bacillota bacterium]